MALKFQPSVTTASPISAVAPMATITTAMVTTAHREGGRRGRTAAHGPPGSTTSLPRPHTHRWASIPRIFVQQAQALATGFHRFLARFSGRRRIHLYHHKYPPPWAFIVAILVSSLISIVEGCSSRTTPKPRPPAAPTPRPNITFHTYECPPEYAAWYCLNGATCFTVKIGNSLIYNCECVESFVGPRCEYKDLDGSYLPSQRKYMLETASIAGGATIAVLSVVMICAAAYLHYRRKAKRQRAAASDSGGGDCVDAAEIHRTGSRHQPTFGARWRTTSSSSGVHTQHPHTFPPSAGTGDTEAEPDSGGGAGDMTSATAKAELRQVTSLLPPLPPPAAPPQPPDAAPAAKAPQNGTGEP